MQQLGRLAWSSGRRQEANVSNARRASGKLVHRYQTLAWFSLGIAALGCTGSLTGSGPDGSTDPNNPNPGVAGSSGAAVDPNDPNAVNTPNPVVTPMEPTVPFTPGGPFDWFDDTKVATGKPPVATCGAPVPVVAMEAPKVAPAGFVATCSGCHTLSGGANSRYPDLFKFAGTVDQFKAKVRMGGMLMAAYPAALISDADLEAAFGYFKGTTRETATSCPCSTRPPVAAIRPSLPCEPMA